MAPKPRFTDGEKVLCFHGPLLYEAKCLKSQIKDKHMKYFIHYSGWNKNWDEWVPECRVLKYNETNLQKQKELAKTHMKAKKSKSAKVTMKKETEKEPVQAIVAEKAPKPKLEKKVSVSAQSSSTEESPEIQVKVKKDKPFQEPCFMEDSRMDVAIKVTIPLSLKFKLVDDWDLITRQKKILSLPARVTVDHVIASFVWDKVSVNALIKSEENTIVQITHKIRECFNVLLGKALLYKFERQQYSEMLAEYPDVNMSQIYGAIHLVRLLTIIGDLLMQCAATEKGIPKLLEHLNDFARYMSANENFFSLNDYVVASPEYHRRSLG